MGLENYFQLEGLAYRLVPYSVTSSDGQTGIVHNKKMYDRLVNKFQWGGLNKSDLYFDETNTRMVMNFRNNYSRLAESLYQKGENTKAITVLDKCMEEFPRDVVNLSYFAIPIIDLYYKLGETEKGNNPSNQKQKHKNKIVKELKKTQKENEKIMQNHYQKD